MTSIREAIRRRFAPEKPLEPGIYHYQTPPYAQNQYRLHLRIEGNGSGILIINASTVLHLNQTAAEYAYHLVAETPPEEIARKMSRRYDIAAERIVDDFQDFKDRIFTLIDMPDLDPVQFLDLDREEPYSSDIAAPYRLDLAITYRLPQGVNAQAAPTRRVDRELSTEEWIGVINKAWGAGVPHLIFTGGEPTLREDLPVLIQQAENNGQVAGLLTDGRKLSDHGYLQTILLSGLDHLMVILQPADALAWQALENIMPQDLFTTVHLTITPEDRETAPEVLQKLARLGVTSISLTSVGEEMDNELLKARELAAELGMSLVWDLPVPYSARNPVFLESEEMEYRDGAGIAWMYVEPDGDVLPSQGVNQVLGNLARQDWEKVWKK